MTRKPFKIMLKKDSEKHGVVVQSLEELQEKARTKFGLDDLQVRLEDGTIVDDGDYFSYLDANTCLVISPCKISKSEDGLDGEEAKGKSVLSGVISSLQDDISKVTILSKEQLYELVEADSQVLEQKLNLTRDEVDSLQEVCHTHLHEMQKSEDAVELLKLFQKHTEGTDNSSLKNPFSDHLSSHD